MQTLIEAEEKPLGVIESLQQGFHFLNRHLWLLLPPVLLDLFLWLGPRVTIGPVIDRFLALYEASPSELPADFTQNMEVSLDILRQIGGSVSLLSLLAGLLTRIPSLLSRLDYQSQLEPVGKVIVLDDVQTAALLVLILIPLGILIGSFWLTQTAFALQNRAWLSLAFLRRWGWVWLNLNLYLLVLMLAGIGLGFLMLLVALTMLFLGNLGMIVYTLTWILVIGFVIWLSIGLYFVVYGIALDGVNLARAAWRSLNVVGRNAVSTLGLLMLVLLLTEGFARIWAGLSDQAWGVALSILGNAYLGVGIVAAGFLFYQSRYQHWQKTRALLLDSPADEEQAND